MAVTLSGHHDPAIGLDGDRMREFEAAEIGVDPAALPERRVELAVRQEAKRSEVPVGGPVDQLADGHDPPVGLDRHVLGDPRQVVVVGRPHLECAQPAVA
jgi:hypothetical protein